MNPTETATVDLEAAARALLARNGVVGEPHPMLLEDTVRELEYHGIPADLELEPAPAEDEWTVERQEFELPCDHPACDLMHRHLFNSTYADGPQLVHLYDLAGNYVRSERLSRFHVKTRNEWVVLHNGRRVGDSHDTKRDALAQAADRPTV